MAQTIKAVTPVVKLNVGGATLVVAKVEMGTEYKAGGVELTTANLVEAGLTTAWVYSGYVNAELKTNTTGTWALVIEKPGEAGQVVKLVEAVLGTATIGKPHKEPADKDAELKEQNLLVTLIGK